MISSVHGFDYHSRIPDRLNVSKSHGCRFLVHGAVVRDGRSGQIGELYGLEVSFLSSIKPSCMRNHWNWNHSAEACEWLIDSRRETQGIVWSRLLAVERLEYVDPHAKLTNYIDLTH